MFSKTRFGMVVVTALAVVGAAMADGDPLQTAYSTAAQSLSDGIKGNFVVLMPIIGGLLLIVWGPRIAKDLIKYFTH